MTSQETPIDKLQSLMKNILEDPDTTNRDRSCALTILEKINPFVKNHISEDAYEALEKEYDTKNPPKNIEKYAEPIITNTMIILTIFYAMAGFTTLMSLCMASDTMTDKFANIFDLTEANATISHITATKPPIVWALIIFAANILFMLAVHLVQQIEKTNKQLKTKYRSPNPPDYIIQARIWHSSHASHYFQFFRKGRYAEEYEPLCTEAFKILKEKYPRKISFFTIKKLMLRDTISGIMNNWAAEFETPTPEQILSKKIVARTIQEKRSERNMTQAHLAEACGVNIRTIQRLEKRGEASAETLSAVSSVLNLNLKENTTETQEKPDKPTILSQYAAIYMLPLIPATYIANIFINHIAKKHIASLSQDYGFTITQAYNTIPEVIGPTLWALTISIIVSNCFLSLTPRSHKQAKIILTATISASAIPPLTTMAVLLWVSCHNISTNIIVNDDIQESNLQYVSEIARNTHHTADEDACLDLASYYRKSNITFNQITDTTKFLIKNNPILNLAQNDPQARTISTFWKAYPLLTSDQGPWKAYRDTAAYNHIINTCISLAKPNKKRESSP